MARTLLPGAALMIGLLNAPGAGAARAEARELSLAELMSLQSEVGMLTRMQRNSVPASVTTITEEDIRLTPARNLLDLFEALVPGAMFTEHPEQPRLGMRGIIVDRNYKFLLLVDGHLMNQRTHSGVVSELQNWDLSDIHQIEIIRGPGSVTYGPGAVAGVVAITTKTAENAPGFTVSTSEVVPYSSQGGTFQYAHAGRGWSLYSCVNATWTRGYEDPIGFSEFGSANMNQYTFGAVGTSSHTTASRKYANNALLADYDRDVPGMPQVRAHLNASLPAGFEGFLRYTQGGNTTGAAWSKAMSPESLQVDSRTFLYRQAVASLGNRIQLGTATSLAGRIEMGSQDFERYSGTIGDRNSLTSPINSTHNFAESDITTKVRLNTAFLEEYQFALGAEHVYSNVGPGWFDDPRALRFGDGQNLVEGPDSWVGTRDTLDSSGRPLASPPTGLVWTVPYSKAGSKQAIFVGDGIGSHTWSLMGEANLAFHEYATLLLSGRADRNTWSAWMVSPRVALVSAITPKNILKAIWQKSMRMNTLEQMYLESEVKAGESDPEVLEGYELIYTALPTDQFTVNVSGYRNDVETIGWSTISTATELQGDMTVVGGEFEVAWRNERWGIHLDHSISVLEDFHLANGQSKSGVSYSDMDLTVPMIARIPGTMRNDTIPVHLSGFGRAINNWSENISKAVVRCKASPNVTLQATSRLFWGFQGYEDQLGALRNARSTRPGDTVFTMVMKPMIDSFVALVEAEDPYAPQLRVDLSAEWQLSRGMRLTGMVQNAFGTGDNRRFDYISGLNFANPRTAWVEEPRTFFLKLTSTF